MDAFIQGPLVVVAFLIFIFGCAIQVLRCYRLSRSIGNTAPQRRPPVLRNPVDPSIAPTPMAYRLKLLKYTVFGAHPIMIGVTTVFHACILLLPPFVLAHNVMLDSAWGFSLPSLPDSIADKLTVVVILGAVFFICRRLFVKRVRWISGAQDYLLLLIATAPFVTGYLAYHQIYDYKTVATLHILTGELLLIAAPFSKLIHMVYFFFGRFLVIHENNLAGIATRVWR